MTFNTLYQNLLNHKVHLSDRPKFLSLFDNIFKPPYLRYFEMCAGEQITMNKSSKFKSNETTLS